MKLKHFFIFTIFSLCITAYSQGLDKQLPNETVTYLDGSSGKLLDKVSESDLTVISFWATWCKPCRKELENISDIYEDWQVDYGVQLLAVSIDDARTKGQVKTYIESQGLPYTVIMDDTKLLFQKLNGTNPPLTIVVNKKGEILKTKLGYLEGEEFDLEDSFEKFLKN